MVIPISGLFETHLPVSDLGRSLGFYCGQLGWEIAGQFDDRGVAFLWIGSEHHSMLGLWEVGTGSQQMVLHTAFRVDLDGLWQACERLHAAGIAPLDFDGAPAEAPNVLAWMPAAVVYFRDPDGHLLEYLAPLQAAPRPELGVATYSQWQMATTQVTPLDSNLGG